MDFRVFVTGSGISSEARDLLERERCLLMQGDPNDSSADIARKLADFRPHALIVRQGSINDDVIAASANLQVIAKHGTGTDNIDIKAASNRNIPVMYTPDANYESAAEHTLALILSLMRNIPEQNRNVRCGHFDKTEFRCLELLGKTLGLIGYGRIARRVSELVAPFNMKVLVFRRSSTEITMPTYVTRVPTLAKLLSQSDIVSLHVPLTPETRGMINSDAFSRMKNDAYLINTARGSVVNEEHLIKALQDGQIRGAGLDTYELEPPPYDNPLYKLNNVILTMHTAGNSDLSLKNMSICSARNVLAVLKNESLDSRLVINQKLLSAQ